MGIRDVILTRVFGKEIKEAVKRDVQAEVLAQQRLNRATVARQNAQQTGGFLSRYQEHALDGQVSESSVDELMDRYAVQPGIRAAIDKVAKIVGTCKPQIKLRQGGKEDLEIQAYLEGLISNPDGRISFETLIFETVVRIKVTGECFWENIFPDQAALDAMRPVATKAIISATILNEPKYKSIVDAADLEPTEHRKIARKARDVVKKAIDKAKQRPVGFRLLQGTVNPIVDDRGNFISETESFVQIVESGKKQFFPLHKVLWMKGPNPLGGAHALAPMETLRFLDDIDQKVQVYYNSILDNRGELGGVITVKNPGVGELDRVREEIDSKHSGPENAGKWHVVGVDTDGDTKVAPFATKPIELENMEAGMRRLRLMWALLNVPGGKVGFINDVNRANIEMQDKALLEEEVIPIAKLVCAPFNHFIHTRLGITDYYLEFSQADLRTEREKAEIRKAKFGMGTTTLNELLREEYGDEGMDVQGGDYRFVDMGKAVLVFTKESPVHVLTASGTCIPLFSDTSVPGAEVVDPLYPQRRPLAPDLETDPAPKPAADTPKE